MVEKQKTRKHIPIRTCVVCRQKDDKRDLMRIVRTDDGVHVDPSGKIEGRGAYLCSQTSCWERAVMTNILNKALKTMLTEEDRQRLQWAAP